MIDLTSIWARWSGPFTDDRMVDQAKAHELRAKLREALGDLHDLVRLALEVQTYGKQRIVVSKAYETWQAMLRTDYVGRDLTIAGAELDAARQELERARDRVERLAVAIAGGNVAVVCDGEVETVPEAAS